jgi:hypothetical protein
MKQSTDCLRAKATRSGAKSTLLPLRRERGIIRSRLWPRLRRESYSSEGSRVAHRRPFLRATVVARLKLADPHNHLGLGDGYVDLSFLSAARGKAAWADTTRVDMDS